MAAGGMYPDGETLDAGAATTGGCKVAETTTAGT